MSGDLMVCPSVDTNNAVDGRTVPVFVPVEQLPENGKGQNLENSNITNNNINENRSDVLPIVENHPGDGEDVHQDKTVVGQQPNKRHELTNRFKFKRRHNEVFVLVLKELETYDVTHGTTTSQWIDFAARFHKETIEKGLEKEDTPIPSGRTCQRHFIGLLEGFREMEQNVTSEVLSKRLPYYNMMKEISDFLYKKESKKRKKDKKKGKNEVLSEGSANMTFDPQTQHQNDLSRDSSAPCDITDHNTLVPSRPNISPSILNVPREIRTPLDPFSHKVEELMNQFQRTSSNIQQEINLSTNRIQSTLLSPNFNLDAQHLVKEVNDVNTNNLKHVVNTVLEQNNTMFERLNEMIQIQNQQMIHMFSDQIYRQGQEIKLEIKRLENMVNGINNRSPLKDTVDDSSSSNNVNENENENKNKDDVCNSQITSSIFNLPNAISLNNLSKGKESCRLPSISIIGTKRQFDHQDNNPGNIFSKRQLAK